jgi:DNA-binding MarR family transcriptional regulator
MQDSGFSVFDFLEAHDWEAEILVILARRGPTSLAGLAQALDCPAPILDASLASLEAKGCIRVLPDGRIEIAFS